MPCRLRKTRGPLIAPSPISWSSDSQVPREMVEEDFDAICHAFVSAARRAEAAGFDMLEIQAGHGTLLSAFLSPLTNHRKDEYGGSLEGRLRFPIHVFRAVRDAWPQERPISVRISAVDWVEGGATLGRSCSDRQGIQRCRGGYSRCIERRNIYSLGSALWAHVSSAFFRSHSK